MTAARRVLVVEDDDDVRGLITGRLAGAGYSVVGAATGETAVALARQSPPSLIVLDILLPGIDGWQALRQIRAETSAAKAAVIVVSIVDPNRHPDHVDAYIVKPFRSSQLVEKVDELMGPPKER